jgi:predicted TIM-barrel fold metal-dependent hydrolase
MNRREFLRIQTTALAATIAGSSRGLAAQEAAPLDIIDCHTHFYDPSRPEGVPWPGKGTPLHRTVLPKDLRALAQHRPVTGTVIVEASPRLEDNQWLLDLAKDDPFVVGVVGNIKPGEPAFETGIRRFARNPLFRGIRIASATASALLERNEIRDLRLLSDLDLQLDINGGSETPAIVARVAEQNPGLRIVLNHMGNAEITAQAPPRDWQEGIRRAAQQAGTFCKISAFTENAARNGGAAPTDAAFYKPYIDVVWDAFGEDRVIYGSNWPVCERVAEYALQQRISLEYALARGGMETARKFCSLNAKRAYKWVERPGRRAAPSNP